MTTFGEKLNFAKESLVDFVSDAVEGKPLKLEFEDILLRRSICNACEHKKKLAMMEYCELCGCSITLKSQGASFSCPKKLWPGDNK